MKGYRQRVSKLYQHFRTLNIDTIAFMEYSQDEAVRADLLGRVDIIAHGLKFVIGITEIAGPRANQDMNGDAHVTASGLHETRARSDSAGGQVAAQFKAVRATARRRDGVVHRFHADFQNELVGHGLRVRRTGRAAISVFLLWADPSSLLETVVQAELYLPRRRAHAVDQAEAAVVYVVVGVSIARDVKEVEKISAETEDVILSPDVEVLE